MREKRYYFWYSAKQLTSGKKMSPEGSHCEVLIPDKAEWQTYTECTRFNRPFGNWDDYVFLGSLPECDYWGSIRIDGVRQGQ